MPHDVFYILRVSIAHGHHLIVLLVVIIFFHVFHVTVAELWLRSLLLGPHPHGPIPRTRRNITQGVIRENTSIGKFHRLDLVFMTFETGLYFVGFLGCIGGRVGFFPQGHSAIKGTEGNFGILGRRRAFAGTSDRFPHGTTHCTTVSIERCYFGKMQFAAAAVLNSIIFRISPPRLTCQSTQYIPTLHHRINQCFILLCE
mmetsp:Transcript_10547/g.39235  ORF Transcript_10547/g.39235 Transcript_10547/m.39235 type:complete len:200 (-) Transcript_10547:122-721(-)